MPKVYTDSYTRPVKPKKPKTPKSGGQPARPAQYKVPRANTAPYHATYDPAVGPTVNQLKPGRGGATSAVGLGGMFNLQPWQKQKGK